MYTELGFILPGLYRATEMPDGSHVLYESSRNVYGLDTHPEWDVVGRFSSHGDLYFWLRSMAEKSFPQAYTPK
jgi:hypothetical protein